MCCFAQPVLFVGNTQIFARFVSDNKQAIVYEMQYESATDNAMILPIPTARGANEKSVRFIDLSSYPKFFRDLSRAFPALEPLSFTTRSKVAAPAGAAPKLEVHEVGSFIASLVPQAEDFRRLDPQFSIPPETWGKIPIYSDYSFVVFQLKSGAARPHPMAFEFDSRHLDELFFPTVHIHDGLVHEQEEFDHTLYCQLPEFDDRCGRYTTKPDESTRWTRSQQTANRTVQEPKAQGLVDGNLLLHRKNMIGNLSNRDVFVSRTKLPLKQKQSAWPLLRTFGGGSLALLGASWLIHRRSKLQGSMDSRKGSGPVN